MKMDNMALSDHTSHYANSVHYNCVLSVNFTHIHFYAVIFFPSSNFGRFGLV